ncbi:MAG: ABC transporter substrate-binding protein [Chlamydiota bacterium]
MAIPNVILDLISGKTSASDRRKHMTGGNCCEDEDAGSSRKQIINQFPYSRLFILMLLLLCGCSSGSQKDQYRVGMDPSWYPMELGTRNNSITAFSTDLLTEVGLVEKVGFTKISVSWDNLMLGLQKGEYQGILSATPPYVFNQQLFDFSDSFLSLGPVLVVPVSSPLNSLDQLIDKEVAVITGSSAVQLLEKVPGVMIRYYPSIPAALNDVAAQVIDGAVIDNLSAISYCQDHYQGQLMVATPPLSDEGLRLVTKHNDAPQMIKAFNEGLSKLKKSGEYDKILSKWGLVKD